MPSLKIDNLEVTVPAGSTVLEAARALGIDIPNLCYRGGCTPNTSCMCCVVRVNASRRLLPSCATLAADGMEIESETAEIHAARRTALELLLADHAGDCRGPCQGVCPAKMDIPKMIAQIDAGELHEALVTVKQHIALPAILGRICPELCEKGCRRSQVDAPVSICQLKRFVADEDLARGPENAWLPPVREATGKRVAIVGTGPAGLSAAWYLLQLGNACTLFDEHDEPGGNLRYAIAAEKLPRDVLDAEIEVIKRLGAVFHMRARIGDGAEQSVESLAEEFDAVLLAVGEVDAQKARALGVQLAGKGLKADRKTMQTGAENVFAAGAAVVPYRHAVRAAGDGRSAALIIDQYLRGMPLKRESGFNIRLGTLTEAELATLTAGAVENARQQGDATSAGLSADQAQDESARCLHCECGKLDGCRLRKYSMVYEADPSAWKLPRREAERVDANDLVRYERGKCIQCGLCVQIATTQQEKLGLAFIGRGFDVRVAVPFDGELAEGLEKAAKDCAEACPTGALTLRATST